MKPLLHAVVINLVLSAYAPGTRDCPGTRTALGVDAVRHSGAAMDPKLLRSLGLRLGKCRIRVLACRGLAPRLIGRWMRVDDTGGRIKRRRIDVRVRTKREADRIGMRRAVVEIGRSK